MEITHYLKNTIFIYQYLFTHFHTRQRVLLEMVYLEAKGVAAFLVFMAFCSAHCPSHTEGEAGPLLFLLFITALSRLTSSF